METDALEEGPVQTLRINRLMTDGVVETPIGAHFTECVPDYGRDEAFQKEYAGDREGRELGRVAAQYVDCGDHAEYRKVVACDRRAADREVLRHRACAECFRGDGEIMANPIGTIPTIGGRLARTRSSPTS